MSLKYSVNFLFIRIQAMEFDPGILVVKPPVDGGLGGIALPLQDWDFPAEGDLPDGIGASGGRSEP